MKHLRYYGLLVTAILAVLVICSHASAQNLLANPGFEALGGSYDGWFTFGGGPQISTVDSDNISRTDTSAAKIFGEFANCPASPSFTVGGFGQAFTPTVGMIYELSGYSYVSNLDSLYGDDVCVSNRLLAKIVFFNAASGGAELASNEVIIGDNNTPLDQWNEFNVSIPCPAGALRVEALFLFLHPACDTGSVYVDDVNFSETTPPTPPASLLANGSFNGGLTGWTTFGNVWYDGRTFTARTPSGGAKLFGPFANPGDASGMFQEFHVNGGTELEFGLHAMHTCVESPINGTNDNYGSIKLLYVDSGGIEVGSDELVILDNTTPLGGWNYHLLASTAPAGTDTVKAYVLFIQPTAEGGAFWVDDASLVEIFTVGIEDGQVPGISHLYQNVPNPFNPVTRIDFSLEEASSVDINVYDVAGRHIVTLFSGHKDAGMHSVNWDGKSSIGTSVVSGVYYYSLKAGDESNTKKMVLLR